MKWLLWLQKLPKSLQIFFKYITKSADYGLSYFLLAIILYFTAYQRLSVYIIIYLVTSFISCDLLLKNLVNRKRPSHINSQVALLINNPKDKSFPSGHTYKAFGIATLILFLGPIELFILALIYAILVALSRMVLFVHYLSDIIGGFILGIIHGLLLIYLLQGVI